MINSHDVIRSALGWMDTPYKHQGRLKGVAVDCAGLVIKVAHELGISDYDKIDYPRDPVGAELLAICDALMDQAPVSDADHGMVLVMRFARDPQHLGFLQIENGEQLLIHAFSLPGKVVRHRIDRTWSRRIVRAYKLRGVSYG